MREVYLDVETQKLSSEVAGGWKNIPAFGLSVAVTWDSFRGFMSWTEETVGDLLVTLRLADSIVTYNGERFDFIVLSAYGDTRTLYQHSFDLLAMVEVQYGHRISFDKLTGDTIGKGKSATGEVAVRWWRSGKPELRQRVADYCRDDVALLKELVEYGRQKHYLKFRTPHRRTFVHIPFKEKIHENTSR